MGISLLQWQFDQAICGELMKILDPLGEELKHLKRVRLGTEKTVCVYVYNHQE